MSPTHPGRAERPGRAPRTLQLTKPLRDRIRAGHPWVYDRALAPPPRDLAPGDLVTIADAEGDIALAFADPALPIRARILAPPGAAVDDAWATSRAEAAAAQRARDPLLAGCTGRRWIKSRRPELYGPLAVPTGTEQSTRALRMGPPQT